MAAAARRLPGTFRLAGPEPLAWDRVWLPERIAAPLLEVDFRHQLAATGVDVRNMAGGMKAWAQAGLPITADDDEPGTVG